MEYVTLNNGVKMPKLGFGVFQIKNPAQCEQAVLDAISVGYRLIDTAASYGNEEAVGQAIKKCGVPREELFITTKVWNTAQRIGDIEGALERSLERLGSDYADLYLIHWPVPGCYPATWEKLIRLREAGMVRSIGVSNFDIPHLEQLFQLSGVIPAVNQIECHPLWNRGPLIRYCQERGIAVQAYAPLARGAYAGREMLQLIGSRYGKTAVQVGLRWLIQQNVAVIPKSVHPDRIRSNFDIFDFELTPTEMKTIDTMDEQFRSASVPDDLLGTDWEK